MWGKYYYVYILLSKRDHQFYIGLTSNLEKRLKRHAKGDVPSTKFRRPLKLIFFEGYLSRRDASRREKYFKTTKGKTSIRTMLQEYLNAKDKPLKLSNYRNKKI